MSNPVYGKSAKRSIDVEKSTWIHWVLLICLILLLIWSPFQAALFNGLTLDFEEPLFWGSTAASVLLLIWIARYYKEVRLKDQRDWMAVWVLLLPLTYIVSSISAASHFWASNMVVVQSVYAIFFILGLYMLRDPRTNRIIQHAIMAIAYFIVAFGFLNWFGHGKFAGALVNWFSDTVTSEGIYANAVMEDSNGLRLTSVFQYANTYAAFLMAFLFAAVFYATVYRKWYVQAIHGFMLVPIIVSVLLTLSRGGLVMLPVVFVMLLLFLKPAQQILWILYCAIAGAASLAISKPVTELGLQLNKAFSGGATLKGWGILLGASIVVALLVVGIQRFLAPKLEQSLSGWSAKRGSSLWIPVGSVVVGSLLIFLVIGTGLKNILPQNISTRLENINFQQHSVLERLTFYKDSMKVVADYPLIGAGGGGWAALYQQYQNNPYTSNQAHTFFLQYLIEVGIIGFVIFMSFILYIFYKYIRGYVKSDEESRRSHFVYLILVLSILMHSILDFNMTYVFLGMLVFLGLGGMAAVMENRPLSKLKISPGAAKGLYSAAVGLGAVILLITSIRYGQAASAAQEAKKISRVSQSFEEIKKPLDKDLSIRPNRPESVVLMSSLYYSAYSQTQDENYYILMTQLLDKAQAKEPFNKSFLHRKVQGYDLKGEQDKSFEVLIQHGHKFKWDMEWLGEIINRAYNLGIQAKEAVDPTASEKYFKEGIAAFEKVQAGVEHLKTLPEGQLQGKTFETTPSMILYAGKMHLITNQLDKATATLKLGLQEDLSQPIHQEIAISYLAALQEQGQSDDALLAKLKKANPDAEKQIQEQVK